MMDFEQAKKVLQLTESRIKRFGAVDTSTSDEIQRAIFRFQPFQRLVIAHHAQEALTRLREQIAPLENSLEQLIGTHPVTATGRLDSSLG
jgi:polyhydroxyalkanoate synthesis regulator phasin